MSTLLCPNPDCGKQLKETAKPHCLEKRTSPCGWVRCSACQTVLDRHGKHFTNPVQAT
jgi:hypothetical protein